MVSERKAYVLLEHSVMEQHALEPLPIFPSLLFRLCFVSIYLEKQRCRGYLWTPQSQPLIQTTKTSRPTRSFRNPNEEKNQKTKNKAPPTPTY